MKHIDKDKIELINTILQSSDTIISKDWLLKHFGLDDQIKYREKKIQKIKKRTNE